MKSKSTQTNLFNEEEAFILENGENISNTPTTFESKDIILYEKYAPKDSMERRFVNLLIKMEDWKTNRCFLAWKIKSSKNSRLYCQLHVSVPRNANKDYSLLLTPTVTSINERSDEAIKKRTEYRKSIGRTTVPPGNLAEQVSAIMKGSGSTNMVLLPSPTTQEPTTNCELTENNRRKTKDGKNSHSLNLGRLVVMGTLLTPSASDGMRSQMTMESLRKHNKKNADKSNLAEQIAHNVGGGQFHLSPQFVMEMMGFPTDWTILPFIK